MAEGPGGLWQALEPSPAQAEPPRALSLSPSGERSRVLPTTAMAH